MSVEPLDDVDLRMLRRILAVDDAPIDADWVRRLDARLEVYEWGYATNTESLQKATDQVVELSDDLERQVDAMDGIRSAHPPHGDPVCHLCLSIQYANGADFALPPWMTGPDAHDDD